jgi:hypothetical protein
MAKVRIAQARYPDSLELLNKSAKIRVGLFGENHPSIAKVRAEIERVRKLLLNDETALMQVIDKDDLNVADRYGNSTSKETPKSDSKK